MDLTDVTCPGKLELALRRFAAGVLIISLYPFLSATGFFRCRFLHVIDDNRSARYVCCIHWAPTS